jgi:inosose dehydratase
MSTTIKAGGQERSDRGIKAAGQERSDRGIKIAGAPISWGVCEVPGWGYQLKVDRVLREMRGAGLTATELGPEGFLPTDTEELKSVLRESDLACVGGFVPVVLFKDDHDPADELAGPLESLVAAGAGVVVLAAATGSDGYDSRPVLNENQWATLLANLDRLGKIAADRGLLAVLHPHVGTIVETKADVDRVLAGSSIPLCLDTGHLLIGGTDPLELAKAVPDRIAHTHLKDVDAALAAKVQSGELTYTEAVKAGMYTPLGTGDVDIAGIVSVLRDNGFNGWFVLEQDTILDSEPTGEGPVRDVLASVAYLNAVTS